MKKAKGAMNRYQLDMLGGTRMFRRLGGYTKNGQMEKLGQMLNDGQRRQTEILVEGESLFANVTGKEHLKEVEAFAGPGAELVDIGLKDSKGNAVPLNHAQLCSLYMLLRNEDSRHHLMTGGLTLPDAAQYAKGNIERAYQRSQTVMLGTLVNADGIPMADTILQTVQDAMTDYDRNWCKDMEDFFGRYTTNLINETSMKLLGYDRATVKNYYPIAVDRSTLATEIEGVKMDATSRADVVVQSGKAYTAALTLNEGYRLISIKVTMGGEDVTATAWNEKKMTVSIPDVTGNIVITAEAKLPMLKELAVGAVTKLVEKDGTAAEEFVVIAQDYEKELNGEGRTLLARRHGITGKKWNTTWCTYADSLIDVYLNSEYLKDAPQALKDILTETKFYYTPGYSGSGSSYTGSHTVTTLSRKVFLPSCYEFGFESYGYTSASSPKYYHLEGSTFADAKKLALALLAADAETAGSVPNTYFHFCLWTRTPVLNDYGSGLTGSALKEYLYKCAEAVWAQMLTAPDKLNWGGYKVNEPENMSWPDLYRCWTHPCFTLPGNTVIDAKGNIVEVREE